MADINSKQVRSARPEHNATPADNGDDEAAPAAAEAVDATAPERVSGAEPDAELLKFVELLFFAYRDFTGDADELLADLAYGRAHHRVIHFVARHPGLRVADLLDILRITKQSLARVLKQVVEDGFVAQRSGETDRRERRLYLTQKGLNLADKLARLQCARVARALDTVGEAGRERVEAFLFAMISGADQAGVMRLFETAVTAETPTTRHDARQAFRSKGD